MEVTFIQRLKVFIKRHAYAMVVSFCVVMLVMIASVSAIVLTNKNMGSQYYPPMVEDVSNPKVVTMIMPVKNSTLGMGYAENELLWSKTLKQWQTHQGVDFMAEKGSNVCAVLNGTVEKIENNMLEGIKITIKHDGGIVTGYSSLADDIDVKVGDKVLQGQFIGRVGNSSLNEIDEGIHLHFEVWQNGILVNPADYIAELKK
ncbi:MAG: M23 family metallopeptidase [Clostridia bacterium]